jgi:hypothetical protein
MKRQDYLHLLGEKTALERMIAETPDDEVLDRSSLLARLREVEQRIAEARPDEREPARVRLTFQGRPVIGSHGIFADFGTKAVSSFVDSVAAMAASQTGPLSAMGPIPNRNQHQMLITSTALGSFGFELEEYRAGQMTIDETSAVAQALDRTQRLLQGTLGTDEELADSVAEVDSRALDKVRAFLQMLVDNDAVCTMGMEDVQVRFSDVGQVRLSLERLRQENLREEELCLEGALQGVLPRGRDFEFKRADTGQIIRGKIGPAIRDPDALNQLLHHTTRIKVMVKHVGKGRPRYVLLEPPLDAAGK